MKPAGAVGPFASFIFGRRSRIARLFRQLLRVDRFRYLVTRLRFWYFTRVRGELRVLQREGPDIAANTVRNNLLGLQWDYAVQRSYTLIRPIAVIESLGPDARVLSIGPRTEGELLNLAAHGFAPWNVKGLDLLSYSPWVDLGDMHEMPYPESSWDAVMMGWVLSYSENRRRAALEVVRVVRPGGVVAVGIEYNPLTNEEIIAKYGFLIGDGTRITSTEEILAAFEGHVDRIYFRHDILAERRGSLGAIVVVFSVKK